MTRSTGVRFQVNWPISTLPTAYRTEPFGLYDPPLRPARSVRKILDCESFAQPEYNIASLLSFLSGPANVSKRGACAKLLYCMLFDRQQTLNTELGIGIPRLSYSNTTQGWWGLGRGSIHELLEDMSYGRTSFGRKSIHEFSFLHQLIVEHIRNNLSLYKVFLASKGSDTNMSIGTGITSSNVQIGDCIAEFFSEPYPHDIRLLLRRTGKVLLNGASDHSASAKESEPFRIVGYCYWVGNDSNTLVSVDRKRITLF